MKAAAREKSLWGSCMKNQRKGGWQKDSVRRAWKKTPVASLSP